TSYQLITRINNVHSNNNKKRQLNWCFANLLNCLGDCMLKMQLQEGPEDSGASKHEATQGPQGAKGI
ncbi:hypothetical protein L9G15_20780, partial [Shewanella sp. A3A]|nr:hypothetical protein [Shewanella ferrihydritica]